MRGEASTKAAGAKAPAGGGGGEALGLLPWPKVDFTKFGADRAQGPVAHQEDQRRQPASQLGDDPARHQPRRRRHHRARSLPRVQLNKENEKSGIKVTMLAFLIKACVAALKKFPEFNASLDGDQLVLKQYFHIGFAADTPNGLVVPVHQGRRQEGHPADQPGDGRARQEGARRQARPGRHVRAPASRSARSAASAARYFTPIINAPEVAILGVCKSADRSRCGTARQFQPRLMLPLSLSWDHRVIDGASAARFNAYLAPYWRTSAGLCFERDASGAANPERHNYDNCCGGQKRRARSRSRRIRW